MRVRHWRAAAAPTRALPYPHAFLRSRTAQPARTAVRRTVGRVVASTPAPASAGRSSVVIVLGSVLSYWTGTTHRSLYSEIEFTSMA